LPKGEQGFLFLMNASPPISVDPAPRETLAASLRALPRTAWILFFGTFLNKFGGFVVPFLTLYLTSRGYTIGQAGLAVSSYGMGNLVASLLGGHLADKLGRRKTILLSMFSGATMMMMLSQARSFPLIVLLTALTGLTNEFYRPASQALLADLVPAAQRVTAFSALRVSFNAGFAFGPATAGLLAAIGYFWLFAGDAATSVLFGLVALFALPQGAGGSQRNASWGEALRVLRRDRRLHQLLLANFAIALVFFQLGSTFGLQVTHLGFSPAAYGAIVSMNGALIVFCELPLTRITRNFSARRVMAIGYVVCAAGYALNFFAHTLSALVVCMLIFTIGEMITMPTGAAYLANLAPPHMRGRYMGVAGLTWATALIIGPAGGMQLFAAAPRTYWITCAALGLIAALVIFRPPGRGSTNSVSE
jgi:MFS family permease